MRILNSLISYLSTLRSFFTVNTGKILYLNVFFLNLDMDLKNICNDVDNTCDEVDEHVFVSKEELSATVFHMHCQELLRKTMQDHEDCLAPLPETENETKTKPAKDTISCVVL